MKKHKKKLVSAGVLAVLITLLEAWPMICPLLPFAVQCEKTAPLVELGKTKLQELQDAGIDF